MDNTKRVTTYLVARLKDKSAEVRLKTIKDLEDLGDPETLQALRDVVADDNETLEIRRAAQEAGRNIFLKNQLTSQ